MSFARGSLVILRWGAQVERISHRMRETTMAFALPKVDLSHSNVFDQGAGSGHGIPDQRFSSLEQIEVNFNFNLMTVPAVFDITVDLKFPALPDRYSEGSEPTGAWLFSAYRSKPAGMK